MQPSNGSKPKPGSMCPIDVYDSNETLEARLLAGSSGFDIVCAHGEFHGAADRSRCAPAAEQRSAAEHDEHGPGADGALLPGFDPNNEHSTIYMWGTTGIGYNIDAIAERLGADYEVNSWDLVFNPETAAKVADCGISFLDSADEMLPPALGLSGPEPGVRAKRLIWKRRQSFCPLCANMCAISIRRSISLTWPMAKPVSPWAFRVTCSKLPRAPRKPGRA